MPAALHAEGPALAACPAGSQGDRPLSDGTVIVAAERRLGEGDRDVEREVAAPPPESGCAATCTMT